MERWIMHVDMDAFFASVEQRDHEEYRGKPLIVGGLSARGVVSTCSYEARHFGVHSAMAMSEARRRCPQGIFVTGNHEHYQEVSMQIFSIFARFSPCIEPLSIDEAFLDITGMEHLMKDRLSYAMKLKNAIQTESGLIASVGIAPNKFIAKLASDLKKPDGLVIVEKDKIQQILADLPISRIWGVGKKTEEKLRSLGYETIGQIAMADVHKLEACFGLKTAIQLVELANGRDGREVETGRETQSIGKEITFEKDLLTKAQAEKQLLALAEKVGWRLRKIGIKARTVNIKVRTASFHTFTRSRTILEPSNYDEELYRTAIDLFHGLSLRESIRLLGISGSNLSENIQASLFNEDKKQQELYSTIDGLKARFGESIITKAQLLTSNIKK
jgi:DNA polymerase-4